MAFGKQHLEYDFACMQYEEKFRRQHSMQKLSWFFFNGHSDFCVIIKRVYRLRNVEKFVELYFRLSYSSKTKTFCKCICGTYLHTFDFKILTYIILFMYVKIMQIKRKTPEKSLSYIHTNTQ